MPGRREQRGGPWRSRREAGPKQAFRGLELGALLSQPTHLSLSPALQRPILQKEHQLQQRVGALPARRSHCRSHHRSHSIGGTVRSVWQRLGPPTAETLSPRTRARAPPSLSPPAPRRTASGSRRWHLLSDTSHTCHQNVLAEAHLQVLTQSRRDTFSIITNGTLRSSSGTSA